MLTSTVSRLSLSLPLVAFVATVGCHPSDLLTVPAPVGVVTGAALKGLAGAEQAFFGARENAYSAFANQDGSIEMAGLLSDEFTYSYFRYGGAAGIDARFTVAMNGFGELGDTPLTALLAARSSLLVSEPALQTYETGSGVARVGEAYALAGYTELVMAEDYCAGVTLSQALANGGVSYGEPLTTDSLLGTAEAHFDSALSYAAGNDTIIGLASVGLGRTRVDRKNFAGAATAVAQVPTTFVYNLQMPTSYAVDGSSRHPNLYQVSLVEPDFCSDFTVSDREGGNGLNFVSANDPRLVLSPSLAPTCDKGYGLPDTLFYFPLKFGNPSTLVPLATGIEAGLIQAEAALPVNGGSSSWLTMLNTLRGQVSGLSPLTDPGTDTGEVNLLFRERAFWLFGTGTRLGDLRRLIRQYNEPTESVFPTGVYVPDTDTLLSVWLPGPLPKYGPDVNFTLPTQASGITTANPYYKGCTSPVTTA